MVPVVGWLKWTRCNHAGVSLWLRLLTLLYSLQGMAGLLVSTSCASNGGFPRLQCRWLVPSSKPGRYVNDIDSQINKITKLSVRVPRILRSAWATPTSRALEVPEVRVDVNDVYSTLRISLGNCGQVVNVTSSSLLNFSISEQGGHKFLHVGKDVEGVLPVALLRRFTGDMEEDILIRRCYEELYEELSADMLRYKISDSSAGLCGGLITGVPGIGKSLFALYFMARFISDTRFVDRRLAFEYARGKYCYFLPSAASGRYECYLLNASDLEISSQALKNVLILSDLCEKSPPAIKGKYHYIFSSPDPSRYYDHLSIYAQRMYYMPVWSEEELTAVDPNKTAWMDMFTIFGGVPRRVLCDVEADKEGYLSSLDEEIFTERNRFVTQLLRSGFVGTEDTLGSYVVYHLNPITDRSGGYNYRQAVGTFASREMCRRIICNSNFGLRNQLRRLFRLGAGAVDQVLGTAIASQIFESVCWDPSDLAGKI
jgi:hypothetical protein